ncbi:bifunctional hydroxymethylpyrimidine kinase/phosphomethylpyrimidine kinase [Kineosporia sp. J2-2]|uniref:Bifunctional hydroxymethylpyrimidine kinase/phosphomethylpyrimidine kinase n=1 Tax=Kineosporia corallincola TaxID=2835133 RepID=A0ABS5TEK1_9ACTN|nr:bifunctional hydroxymethylpyrimidine kinase/phosphomethylpyrimidine kinase [Kineosporia corallincola]MBT0769520.1 bifunctional hydroxymethylpyrimidine kinase/phosphomethylpyrimidine kinase [Kineosporia corallincola]
MKRPLPGAAGLAARVVPRVLSVAGTDPTGGAGIQADLKSIAANGGYGMAVVTALVAQNTRGVRSVHTPPVEFLREQLLSVSDDVQIDAVKVGMLGDAAVIAEVAGWLRRVRPPVVVIDPVMVATSGDRLLSPEAEQALHEVLPLAGLITPNVPELAVLAGSRPAGDWDEVVRQALEVSARWGVRVLAKGGHLDGGTVFDALVDASGAEPVRRLQAPRVPTTATHGTGCSLSSAVATWQVTTGDWLTSIDRAKSWLTESLRHGEELRVGQGHGPVSHFAGLWERGGLATSASGEWWQRIAQLRADTVTDPFLTGLADGTLGKDQFVGYLAQDTHYLDGYAAVLSRLARMADDPVEQAFWAGSAAACLTTETALHRAWGASSSPIDPIGPVTRAYLDHLETATDAGYEQGVAAVLPCYWMYADIGRQLGPSAAGNPYREWIDTYQDSLFGESARSARGIADRAAADAEPEVREQMWQAFEASAQLERRFFAAGSPA